MILCKIITHFYFGGTIMAKKASYAENMASIEEANDIRYFNQRFERALDSGDNGRLEELVKEGIYNGYDIPLDDPKVAEIYYGLYRYMI